MTQTLQHLIAEFSHSPAAEWTSGAGELSLLRTHTALADGAMFAHGAHVTSWRPAGHNEVLFVSEKSPFTHGKAIRGGVPVCFPWFAARTNDPKPGGKSSPSHGFARTRPWAVQSVNVEADVVRVTCTLPEDDEQHALWDGRASLTAVISFGAELELALTVRNNGSTPSTIELALHSYFRVSDITQVRLSGLEGLRYIDKTDAGATRQQPLGDFALIHETDRVYYGASGTVLIADPGMDRALRVQQSGSDCTVLWNPWSTRAATMSDLGPDDWKRFVCVEACCCGERALQLEPGQSHTLTQRISVQR